MPVRRIYKRSKKGMEWFTKTHHFDLKQISH